MLEFLLADPLGPLKSANTLKKKALIEAYFPYCIIHLFQVCDSVIFFFKRIYQVMKLLPSPNNSPHAHLLRPSDSDPGLTPGAPLVLRLLDLDWNHATSFPGPPAGRWKIVGRLSSKIM